MKTLVMSFVIAATGLFNTVSTGNATQRFAYNTEEDEDAQIQYVAVQGSLDVPRSHVFHFRPWRMKKNSFEFSYFGPDSDFET